MKTLSSIPSAAAELLGCDVVGNAPLHGGDLADVFRLRLGSGGTVVVKSGPFPDREGRMLEAMAAAGAPVPRVLASDTRVLVMEDLGPPVGATEGAWAGFGAALHELHAASAPRYGWDEDYAFGAVAIRNARSGNWPQFWFENRMVADVALLPGDVARRLEALATRLGDLLAAKPPASLLHGDLWSGNIHLSATGAWMIDPACYHGDAEVDLAMLTLFGSPPPVFFEAYGPLAPGWQERRAVYQLWPALVHLRLFGSGYRGLVGGLLDRLGV